MTRAAEETSVSVCAWLHVLEDSGVQIHEEPMYDFIFLIHTWQPQRVGREGLSISAGLEEKKRNRFSSRSVLSSSPGRRTGQTRASRGRWPSCERGTVCRQVPEHKVRRAWNYKGKSPVASEIAPPHPQWATAIRRMLHTVTVMDYVACTAAHCCTVD